MELLPEQDVEVVAGRCIARSNEPWLRVGDFSAFRPGRFMRLTYRAGLFDNPARPVLRFHRIDGTTVDRILPAPVAGAGIWLGRVPRGATGLSISPTHEAGRFDFDIESARVVSTAALFVRGWRQAPRRTISAILTRLIGWRAESDVNLAWAIGFTPFGHYEAWRRERARPLDRDGRDAPRTDWSGAPPVALLVDCAAARGPAIAATIAALEQQIFVNWTLVLHGRPHDPEACRVIDESAARELRIRAATADRDEAGDPVADLTAGLPDEALAGTLAPGDVLRPWALACLVEEAARRPEAEAFYADEERRGGSGPAEPVFKPDWSPWREAAHPYVGRPGFVRVRQVRAFASDPDQAHDLFSAVVARVEPARVRHIRRILVETSEAPADRRPRGTAFSRSDADATIIVPTRDRLDLLAPCVAGLQRTTSARFDVIIVDNASTESATHTFFKDLTARDPRFRVLSHPGPFNYAAICNAGAAASAARVLVFLNNDVDVLAPDWLDHLVAAAIQPDVGAVGAKLLFPDCRVQHVGVVVGMGESAGHFGAHLPEDAAGWLGTNLVAHEASAVTGACQAIERRKFEDDRRFRRARPAGRSQRRGSLPARRGARVEDPGRARRTSRAPAIGQPRRRDVPPPRRLCRSARDLLPSLARHIAARSLFPSRPVTLRRQAFARLINAASAAACAERAPVASGRASTRD